MKIAILDSGVREDLINNKNLIMSVVGDDGIDRFGHGSEVFSVVKRICGNTHCIRSIKVLDDKGKADITAILDAFEVCLREKIDFINFSIAVTSVLDDYDFRLLVDLIEKMKLCGISIFCAANNRNYEKISIPASISCVFGVCGSLMKDDYTFYFDKKRSIQILANAMPTVVRNHMNKRTFFGGNSKATAVITGIASKECCDANSVETVLFNKAAQKHWSIDDARRINELEYQRYEANRKMIAEKNQFSRLLSEYKELFEIEGDLFGRKILKKGFQIHNTEYFNVIEYVEKRMRIIFDDSDMDIVDFSNESTVSVAMAEKWRAYEDNNH